MSGAKRVAVIVQCRLSSTRLPKKALMDLEGFSILEWTLCAMKRVRAERYFLACDFDSEKELAPAAKKCGFEIFAGSRDDVLGRFCDLIEKRFFECEIVLRATADNPFLFFEAAQKSLFEFEKIFDQADYFTFSGLPHGSGIEVFKAASILKARSLTNLPFDREHVGPALYNHAENFRSVFAPAPKEFFGPHLRTTIDTFSDYKRSQNIAHFLLKNRGKKNAKMPEPFLASEIFSALKNPFLQKTILFFPKTKAGGGTGHLRRCLCLAKKSCGFVYIPHDATLFEIDSIIEEAFSQGFEKFRIVKSEVFSIEKMILHEAKWDLIFADLFKSVREEIFLLQKLGPVCSIDDGGECQNADFLLDTIPSDLKRKSNLKNEALIFFPKKIRERPQKIKSVLVTLGGEGNAKIAMRAANAFLKCHLEVFVILPKEKKIEEEKILEKNFLSENAAKKNPCDAEKKIRILSATPNLREKLCEYDLVFTHYGFTAFEAVAAGCRVLLFATSPLHLHLSKKYGFLCVKKNEISEKKFFRILQNPNRLTSEYFERIFSESNSQKNFLQENSRSKNHFQKNQFSNWTSILQSLSLAKKIECPVCKTPLRNARVVARTAMRTFRRCPKCKMLYLAFSQESGVQYEADYFGAEYKAQYGRTYLEDFSSIKEQGVRRAKIIKKILEQSGQKFPSNKTAISAGGGNAAQFATPPDLCERPAGGGMPAASTTPATPDAAQPVSATATPPDLCERPAGGGMPAASTTSASATASPDAAASTTHASAQPAAVPLAPTLLDIGCAYGPFLAAASEQGFSVFGNDISSSAAAYVKNTLCFPCAASSFLSLNSKKEFGKENFHCVSMWFVIEHFEDLQAALTQASSLLKRGGVFAFSTPSASGISARFSRQKFFEQSPRDHFSLWEVRNAKRILKRFGFRTKKIVATGIHPERLALFRNLKKGTFLFSLSMLLFRLLKLGDTFEVYCVKK